MPSQAVTTTVNEANAASGAGQLFRPSAPPAGPKLARLALKLISSSSRSKAEKHAIKEAARRLIEGTPNTERLTFYPSPTVSDDGALAYNPQTRTAEVIIIEVGRGNSRDKHYYGADTIRQAAADKVFDGSQAYADHPSLQEDIDRPERSIRDLVGYYFNTHVTEVKRKDGTRVPALAASLKIQDGADWAIGLIREAIDYNKRYPDKTYVGISINADGDVSPAVVDNEQVNYVRRITEAFSADFVTKPARGGKFLALVESSSGSHKQSKGEPVDKKILESAARLQAQMASGEIDREETDALLTALLKEAAVPASLGEAEKKFVESLNEADKAEFQKLDEAGKPPWLVERMAKAKESHGVDTSDDDADQDASGDDTDEDTDDENNSSSDVAAKNAKESMRESDPKIFSPLIYAAALKEASAKVTGDLATLRKQVAELTAGNAVRDSISLAERLLKESTLPASAATRLLESLVGRPEAQMRRVIENEVAYVRDLGVSVKPTAGAGEKTLALRESESKENESFLFAGMGGR